MVVAHRADGAQLGLELVGRQQAIAPRIGVHGLTSMPS